LWLEWGEFAAGHVGFDAFPGGGDRGVLVDEAVQVTGLTIERGIMTNTKA